MSARLLQEAKDVPAVVDMLAKAKSILGYDLLEMCQSGPKEKLDDTTFAQPALYVAGLAAVEKLRQDSPTTVDACSACAGLSLGEYCALAFADIISFEEGLKVGRRCLSGLALLAPDSQHHCPREPDCSVHG